MPYPSDISAAPSRVLAVGIATLDLIHQVASYPPEDAEVRASASWRRRGGNATNTLVALSQWGHACSWAGNSSDDADADFVFADLKKYGVSTELVQRLSGGRLPSSNIVLSQATGSRTIVHYRDLPEYSAAAFADIDPAGFDWIHFEGRHVPALLDMLARTRDLGGPMCSVEIEKPREDIEAAAELADLVFYSRHYVQALGFTDAAGFLRQLPDGHPEAYCAWGKSGAWRRSTDAVIDHSPAFPPAAVVDTLAAGDVFNAGVIDARLRGLSGRRAVERGCRVAGFKCGIQGLGGLSGAILA
jgi:ketohexokinase